MSNAFLAAAQARRSVYMLGNRLSLSDIEIQETIEKAIAQAPSAFGVQPTRVVILFGAQHDKLWDIVLNTLKKMVSAEQFPATQSKIAGFKAAYATVLFFEDRQVVKDLEAKFVSYADKFADWSMQAQGIALYSVWSALAAQHIGASIQHYFNLISNEVHDTWAIPKNWCLLGEMPIGNIVTAPEPKKAVDVKQLVQVRK